MRKNIGILAFEGKRWLGGLYYKRNLAFELAYNKNILDNYGIFVITVEKDREEFECLRKYHVHLLTVKHDSGTQRRIDEIILFIKYRISIIIAGNDKMTLPFIRYINWIPDFQHRYYPAYFTEKDVKKRDREFEEYAHSKAPLILSSQACVSDFRKFYSASKKNVYLVPFVSFIEEEITSLTLNDEQEILKKYGLFGRRFCYIGNQFWEHKNHLVVFQTMRYLENVDLIFVFTGNKTDSKNPAYTKKIGMELSDPYIQSRAKVLGMLDKREQVAVMKNAQFVIQPSLFEGWGTVTEDAKVLDKTILLSDIPVHREQMNEKCRLFDPHDPKKLAVLVANEARTEHHDDARRGIRDMKKRAVRYSCGMEHCLDTLG